jgi:hypothetical protein
MTDVMSIKVEGEARRNMNVGACRLAEVITPTNNPHNSSLTADLQSW